MESTNNPNLTATVDYYAALGVQRDATEEQIKKGYRRAALKYHPDKAGDSAEAAEKFELISKAYETLQDEKLRKIYDQYGENGLSMMKQMGQYAPFLDPDMLLSINKFLNVMSVIFILLIIFPSFLSARIDNNISWPYITVFIPLFLADIIVLYYITTIKIDNEPQANEVHEEKNHNSMAIKAVGGIYVLIFCLFQILVCLKLDGTIITTWWVVSIPLFILEGVNGIRSVLETIAECRQPVMDQVPLTTDNETVYGSRPKSLVEILFTVFNSNFGVGVRIAQEILIFQNISSEQPGNWVLTFLPTIIYGGYHTLALIITTILVRSQKAVNPEAKQVLTAKWLFFLFWAGLLFTFVGLLIARVGSGSTKPTVGVILIPVFILLGILLCCTSCCIPTMVYVGKKGMEDQMNMSANVDVEAPAQAPDVIVTTDNQQI
ncbi:hypothetical protein BC833DRAFT_579831 [Globomyces pollinis-pini]|nr:hypothetical protein BC833DRAFT_579831 [Globomyces pollinis-pini]